MFDNIFVKYGYEIKDLLWPPNPNSKSNTQIPIPINMNDLHKVEQAPHPYLTIKELVNFIQDDENPSQTKSKYRLEYCANKSKMYLCHDFVKDIYSFVMGDEWDASDLDFRNKRPIKRTE